MVTPRELYNAKDVAATAALKEVLGDLLDTNTWLYQRLMDLQRALLVPQIRGFKVDRAKREQEYTNGKADLDTLAAGFVEVGHAAWGGVENYLAWVAGPSAKLLTTKGAPTALQNRLRLRYATAPLAGATGKGAISRDVLRYLFYGHLNVRGYRGIRGDGKPTKVRKECDILWEDATPATLRQVLKGPTPKGQRPRFSVDEDALSKLDHPLAEAVVRWYDLDKGLQFLMGKLTREDRYRTVYSVGSTKTFRLSCKKNMFGEGGNLQQIPKDRRSSFVADPGKVLLIADYTTAESHILSAFVGGPYWDVHQQEDEDTHVMVGKLMGLDLPRQTCKGIQHAKNYLQTARGMARHLGMTVADAEACEKAYFGAFPEIKDVYHKWIYAAIKEGEIVVPVGGEWMAPYKRTIWGEDAKEIAAHPCQSLLALIAHTAALRVVELERTGDIQLLHHNHDELVVQVPKEDEEVKMGLGWLNWAMTIPVEIGGRELVLRSKVEVRNSWGK